MLCVIICVLSATRQNIHMYPYSLFAAIDHLKSSPTFSVRPRSSVGRVTVDLIRRSWVRFPPRSKYFFFTSCGSLVCSAHWCINPCLRHTKEELNQFITAVNSFHPALKYTWETSNTSLAFLDIKVFVEGNGLCTSVHYKLTDSQSYLLYSSSHPSHVKNSIPYSQFLRLRRLCSEDSDFPIKSEEMCNFFDKRGYPASVVQAGHHRAQQIHRQSALQTSQKENNNRIPFTLTFHLHNHAVKSIILKNFKLLQNDPDTGRIFSQPPFIQTRQKHR